MPKKFVFAYGSEQRIKNAVTTRLTADAQLLTGITTPTTMGASRNYVTPWTSVWRGQRLGVTVHLSCPSVTLRSGWVGSCAGITHQMFATASVQNDLILQHAILPSQRTEQFGSFNTQYYLLQTIFRAPLFYHFKDAVHS